MTEADLIRSLVWSAEMFDNHDTEMQVLYIVRVRYQPPEDGHAFMLSRYFYAVHIEQLKDREAYLRLELTNLQARFVHLASIRFVDQ